VRTRVVEAGVLSVAAKVLKGYLEEREKLAAQIALEESRTRRTLRSARRENSTPAILRTRASDSRVASSSAPVSPTHLHTFASQPSLVSSEVPSRVNTPDNIPSTSNLLLIAAEEANGNSSDGDMDAEKEELPDIADVATSRLSVHSVTTRAEEEDLENEVADEASLAARGRSRSATLKSQPGLADEDQTMNDVEPPSIDHNNSNMDMDSEPVDQAVSEAMLLSPTPSIAQSLSRDILRPRLSVETATPSPTSIPSAAALQTEGFRFRDEDVLLCLQLLAYLSKYPHVRAVFHDPSLDYACGSFLKTEEAPQAPADKVNNIFSLVEKYTVKSNDHRSALAAVIKTETQTKMLLEIQYWAGVIMRNACRKDEARGGIRQCANMLCGAWEKFPREFAKCRRCRKAKYCSKSCQSKAWQGGHRCVSSWY